MAQLKELGASSLSTGMKKLMGNHDKESKLYERQAALEKSILFYQNFPGNENMQKKWRKPVKRTWPSQTRSQLLPSRSWTTAGRINVVNFIIVGPSLL
jgi:hypothetical protein